MPDTIMTWHSIAPAIPEIYLVAAICVILLVDAFAGQARARADAHADADSCWLSAPR